MSEISIKFTSAGINNPNLKNESDASSKQTTTETQQTTPAETTQVSDANTFAYMGNNPAVIAAMANINFVSQPKNNTVNNAINNTIFSDDIASQVATSLSFDALIEAANAMPPEQIASIEASMGKFQEGVVAYAPLVEEELGATASEPAILAVAAGMLLNDDE